MVGLFLPFFCVGVFIAIIGVSVFFSVFSWAVTVIISNSGTEATQKPVLNPFMVATITFFILLFFLLCIAIIYVWHMPFYLA